MHPVCDINVANVSSVKYRLADSIYDIESANPLTRMLIFEPCDVNLCNYGRKNNLSNDRVVNNFISDIAYIGNYTKYFSNIST